LENCRLLLIDGSTCCCCCKVGRTCCVSTCIIFNLKEWIIYCLIINAECLFIYSIINGLSFVNDIQWIDN
jgi:hypothetical protein